MIALLTFRPPISPTPVAPYNLDYLVIAGGGGGGSSNYELNPAYASGGAGGYKSGSFIAATNPSYTVIIGAGGAGLTRKGNNSYFQYFFGKIESTGGGGGGINTVQASLRVLPENGGSGYGATLGIAQGVGIPGEGFAGGIAILNGMGGGGGAGEAGANSDATAKGGDGLTWLDGVIRAGGGGGRTANNVVGAGGAGGGGSGGASYLTGATSGAVNTGSGGGGNGNFVGGYGPTLGGSGIVKFRYAGTPRATGGTITQNGGFTYHEFTSSGRLIFTS